MSASPSKEQIVQALKASGYLMEQEVATTLESLGYHVTTNWAFEDKDEKKSRELDIRAVKRVALNNEQKIAAYFELLVECKNSSNPFVFIGRPKNAVDNRAPPSEYTFPIATYVAKRPAGAGSFHIQETPAFAHLGFDSIHYRYKNPSKAVQFCRIDRKGANWEANHGGLYDAIFYPMAKAVQSQVAEQKNGKGGEWRYFWFIVPLVVSSGEIFYIDSSEADTNPTPVPFVTFKRDIKSDTLNGSFSVDFVRQDSLTAFENDCLKPIIDHVTKLTMVEFAKIPTREIDWKD